MTDEIAPWDAYDAGFISGLRGEDPRVCPHEKMTIEWSWWNEGQRRGSVFHRYANGKTDGQSE